MNRYFVALCTLLTLPTFAVAQPLSTPDGNWTAMGDFSDQSKAGEPWVRPSAYRSFKADLNAMARTLASAPLRDTPAASKPLTIWVPTPDGGFTRFGIVESSVMVPELQAKFPDIHSYIGQGVDDPATNIALDLSPLGYRAQILAPEGKSWSIDPFTRGIWDEYACYEIKNLIRTESWHCHVGADVQSIVVNPYADRATGQTLRTYRLAVAAVPTFTNYYGGTVTGAMSGINTIVTRISQVYTNEFACTFTLVANNNLLIYTTANPGPYTDGNLSTMLGQNQSNIDSIIGSANYNIGHVVSGLNLGGLAQIRGLCNGTGKARGGTGLSAPTGDFFSVEYMGHEMGHQFGANHSFNADDSAGGNVCTPNRNGATAYEPGSGTTIMSYTNLCDSNNQIQPTSTPMFNQGAYAEISAYIVAGGNCGSNASTGNTAPSIAAVTARNLPISTPFTVTASATDVNSDSLTYSWEERDTGPAQVITGAGSADNGTSPMFRAMPPTTDPSRTFPRYANVVTNSVPIGERYLTLARTLRLRVVVRDNRAGGGGVNTSDVNMNVVGTAGPFLITSPSTSVSWPTGSTQTVTWDVANTNVAPISATNVNILLSTDGGTTFPITLASNVPNSGSATITMPNVSTNQARLRVEPTNNIFFDISHANFNIVCTPPAFPNNLVATDDRCDAVNLTWSAVAGATSYEVYRNTTSSTTGATLIGTATTTSFSDTTITPSTTMFYRVKAVNAGCVGSFSGANSGVRGLAPHITSQPASLTRDTTQSATFTVVATGEPLTYSWRKNTVALADGPRVSGSATASLTISNLDQGDAGSYDVVITSSCGNATSTPATLTINSPCIADIDDGTGTGIPDGGVTIDDLLYYLRIFEDGSLNADVDDGSFTGTRDGGITIDDLLYFLFRFESGC